MAEGGRCMLVWAQARAIQRWMISEHEDLAVACPPPSPWVYEICLRNNEEPWRWVSKNWSF